ncbi:MAG: hypothetical protein CL521_05890 [Actinobacteria bacterium]|nr:hypothetical protein [Actinomycetota bacterium]|tara:strand:+ start:2637 stop:2891 length:255 start_codon:yes stop_codon:yes gene_type:complete
MNTQDQLVTILKNYQPNIDESIITQDTPLSELEIDSLSFIEIVYEFETEFNIVIPDDKLRTLRTIGDFLACATANTAENNYVTA